MKLFAKLKKYICRTKNFPFYFQHVPKCGGTSIYRQLPKGYLNMFYGEIPFPRDKLDLYPFSYQLLSKDHIGLEDNILLGRLSLRDIEDKEIIMIWRDPIKRFVSTCNHFKRSPEETISCIKDPVANEPGFSTVCGRYAFYTPATNLVKVAGERVKTTDILLEDFDLITKTFARYGIKVKNRSHNVSEKLFSVNDLTSEQLAFLTEFYAEDFETCRKLKGRIIHNLGKRHW